MSSKSSKRHTCTKKEYDLLCRLSSAEQRSGGARLAGGEHDGVAEELEGDGAEEGVRRARLQRRRVHVCLAAAACRGEETTSIRSWVLRVGAPMDSTCGCAPAWGAQTSRQDFGSMLRAHHAWRLALLAIVCLCVGTIGAGDEMHVGWKADTERTKGKP